MADFDYMASGELFVPQGRAGLRYRRYERAAEAVRYAIEKLPSDLLAGTRLEVEEQHYEASQIRALYDSDAYPLQRNPAP